MLFRSEHGLVPESWGGDTIVVEMAAAQGIGVDEILEQLLVVAELEELRRELERTARGASPLRWNANPDDVQRSVAQLVLTLVEFIRRLLERQACRQQARQLAGGKRQVLGAQTPA